MTARQALNKLALSVNSNGKYRRIKRLHGWFRRHGIKISYQHLAGMLNGTKPISDRIQLITIQALQLIELQREKGKEGTKNE